MIIAINSCASTSKNNKQKNYQPKMQTPFGSILGDMKWRRWEKEKKYVNIAKLQSKTMCPNRIEIVSNTWYWMDVSCNSNVLRMFLLSAGDFFFVISFSCICAFVCVSVCSRLLFAIDKLLLAFVHLFFFHS